MAGKKLEMTPSLAKQLIGDYLHDDIFGAVEIKKPLPVTVKDDDLQTLVGEKVVNDVLNDPKKLKEVAKHILEMVSKKKTRTHEAAKYILEDKKRKIKKLPKKKARELLMDYISDVFWQYKQNELVEMLLERVTEEELVFNAEDVISWAEGDPEGYEEGEAFDLLCAAHTIIGGTK